MEEGGVTELVAAEMTGAEFNELNQIEDRLHYGRWGRSKAERALGLLTKRHGVLASELKKITDELPPDRHTEAKFSYNPSQRDLVIHAEHLQYDLELTRLRLELYQKSLIHGRKKHPEIDAVRERTTNHIQRWLGLRV